MLFYHGLENGLQALQMRGRDPGVLLKNFTRVVLWLGSLVDAQKLNKGLGREHMRLSDGSLKGTWKIIHVVRSRAAGRGGLLLHIHFDLLKNKESIQTSYVCLWGERSRCQRCMTHL